MEKETKKVSVQEIVLNNARLLVQADLPTTKHYIEKSTEFIKSQLNSTDKPDYDFRKDAHALVGIQIQLASLSLALEYWISKIQQSKIKVYDQSAMPKA